MRTIKFRIINGLNQNIGEFSLMELIDKIDCNHIDFTQISRFLQFTGLTDKNGKEIYEGDILKLITRTPYVDTICQIKFTDGAFRLYYKKDLDLEPFNVMDVGFYDLNKYETIGNIYENIEYIYQNKFR
jgi:uncharacterized phage protein (TIGR01671 family)